MLENNHVPLLRNTVFFRTHCATIKSPNRQYIHLFSHFQIRRAQSVAPLQLRLLKRSLGNALLSSTSLCCSQTINTSLGYVNLQFCISLASQILDYTMLTGNSRRGCRYFALCQFVKNHTGILLNYHSKFVGCFCDGVMLFPCMKFNKKHPNAP